MAQTVAGFPFWEAAFDQDGKPQDAAALTHAVQAIKAESLTDLFIFSHGWNNDRNDAQRLYDRFFGEVRKLIDNAHLTKKRAARCGVVGVFWPSILWPDEQANAEEQIGGGAAALGRGADSADLAPLEDLTKVFGQDHADTLRRMLELLRDRKGGKAGLDEFSKMLSSLFASEGQNTLDEDSLEIDALGKKPELWGEAFDLLSDNERLDDEGGAAGLADDLSRLWDGAKGALRVATYWQMKNRAGVVGRIGLGPFIKLLAEGSPGLKIHLLGHSFGARLVSYALAGLDVQAAASPIKSLFLLQGAFSHFTFAQVLPFDGSRSGDLKGKDKMVDGPLLTTFSDFDLAVGRAYPLASLVSGVDAAATQKIVSRWGGMGNDGAQAVDAKPLDLSRPGTDYGFAKNRWYNLDSNQIIKVGDPPSGAHSDIIYPETAWAALSAAAIV